MRHRITRATYTDTTGVRSDVHIVRHGPIYATIAPVAWKPGVSWHVTGPSYNVRAEAVRVIA